MVGLGGRRVGQKEKPKPEILKPKQEISDLGLRARA